MRGVTRAPAVLAVDLWRLVPEADHRPEELDVTANDCGLEFGLVALKPGVQIAKATLAVIRDANPQRIAAVGFG